MKVAVGMLFFLSCHWHTHIVFMVGREEGEGLQSSPWARWKGEKACKCMEVKFLKIVLPVVVS